MSTAPDGTGPGGTARGSLAGVRVLELSTSVAAPFAGQVLADLGAEVVKVERPGVGDDTRTWAPPFWEGESVAFLALNRGKRSVTLELGSDDGRRRLLGLLDGADVFVHNLRPGRLEAAGLDEDLLETRFPRLVNCRFTGYGDRGPLADLPAYDPLVQAFSGLMSLTGHDGEDPLRIPVSILDQGTAMWAVIGILDALRRRDRTGAGGTVHVSLLETALAWMPLQVMGVLATGEGPRRLGSGFGSVVPYGAFPTAEGHLLVAAGNDPTWARLLGVLGRPEMAEDPRTATNPARVQHRGLVEDLLVGELSRRPARDWVPLLRAAGVPVAPIQGVAEAVTDPQVVAVGGVEHREHPRIPGFGVVPTPLRLDGRRLHPVKPPPLLGEDDGADDPWAPR